MTGTSRRVRLRKGFGTLFIVLAVGLALFTVLSVFGYFFIESDDPVYLVVSTTILVTVTVGLFLIGKRLLKAHSRE